MTLRSTSRAAAFAALTSAFLVTLGAGFASAQTPAAKPAAAAPAAATPAAALPPASDSLPVPPPPQIQGTAWVLIDAASGNILASHNPDLRVEPASITKVMTSYVIAAELKGGKVKDTDQVMMTENAWRKEARPPTAATRVSRSTRPRRWWRWKKAWWCSPATTPRSPWPSTSPAAKTPSPR